MMKQSAISAYTTGTDRTSRRDPPSSSNRLSKSLPRNSPIIFLASISNQCIYLFLVSINSFTVTTKFSMSIPCGFASERLTFITLQVLSKRSLETLLCLTW